MGVTMVMLMVMVMIVLVFRVADSQHAHQGGGNVMDLTPAVVDTLTKDRVAVYMVKLDACQSGNNVCSQVDDAYWKPLANMASTHPASANIPFYRLNCNTERELCNELSTSKWMNIIQSSRGVDFITVVYSERAPNNRLVEHYKDEPDTDLHLKYFLDMITRNEPFEPMLLEEIYVPALKKQKVDLAIMVLTVDGFTRPDVWDAFLNTQTDGAKVRIFMHNKISLDALQVGDTSSNMQVDGVIQVPLVYTSRLSPSVVRATIQMLRHAVAYGGATHYLLVSGDTVPLYDLPDVVEKLRSSNMSRFETHAQSFVNMNILRRNYGHTTFDDSYNNNGLIKSKQWIVLNEEAAEFFSKPENDHSGNYECMNAGDEYYFPNLATEFGFPFDTSSFMMYDEWPKEQAKRPFWLTEVDSTDSKYKQGHLFARKITKNTVLRLRWMGVNDAEENKDGKDEDFWKRFL